MSVPNEKPHRMAIGLWLGLLAWPAALWAIAFAFHLGMTGPRSDDWFFQFTHPGTGEPHRWVIPTWSTTHHRPLHHMYVPFIQTAFAEVRWFAVLLSSLGHALAAAMLWRVMRALGIGSPASAAAATLWMLYPVLFEIPLWVAAASTGIATAIALGAVELALTFVRRGGLWRLALIAVGAYACCGFNEQPAAIFAALPFAVLAARGMNLRRAVARTAAVTVGAGIGVGIYLALTLGFLPWLVEGQPGHERGSTSRLVTSLAELETRWNRTKDRANHIMWMPGVFRAAFESGLGALREGPRHAGWIWTAPWLLLTAAAAWVSARVWLRRVRCESHEDQDPAPVRVRVSQVLIATSIFFAGFVPVLVIQGQAMYTRLAYVPAVGLAIGFAALIDAACSIGSWRRQTRTGALLAVFLGVIPAAWALAMLGIQDGLYRRVVQDQRESAELRRLVPEPPVDAAVIVVYADHFVISTGNAQFDGFSPGATNISWAAPDFARETYGRWDVWAISAIRAHRGPVLHADERGVLVDRAMLDPKYPPPGLESDPLRIPLERVIAVGIDPDGRVRLVTELVTDSARTTIPVSAEHARRLGIPGVSVRIPVRGPADAQSTDP